MQHGVAIVSGNDILPGPFATPHARVEAMGAVHPLINGPHPRRCPLCRGRALHDWQEWSTLLDYHSDNNLVHSAIHGKELRVPCLSCGGDVALASLTVVPQDAEEYFELDVDLLSIPEAAGDGMPIGRIVMELADCFPLMDEARIAAVLKELIGWEDVTFTVINF